MPRRKKHLTWALFSFFGLSTALVLVLVAFGSIVFSFSPSELITHQVIEQHLRLGGVVESGSLKRDGQTVRFSVTDLVHEVPVTFTGILPDLFREGQGVVVEGMLHNNGIFEATNVLAKHDETYMPNELLDSLNIR